MQNLLPSAFIFQQDCEPAHTTKLGFQFSTIHGKYTGKDERLPNSLDVNRLECQVWGVMLEQCKTFHPKPKNTDGLKKILQLMWDQLLQDSINKATLSFTKRL